MVKNYIFDILAYGATETEVMVSGKQALKEMQKTGFLNQLDLHRLKVTQAAGSTPIP